MSLPASSSNASGQKEKLNQSPPVHEDGAGRRLCMSSEKGTTVLGFVNPHGQEVIRHTGKVGTDHGQYVYELKCKHCGHRYGANGSDIHERKCPACQDGRPGHAL